MPQPHPLHDSFKPVSDIRNVTFTAGFLFDIHSYHWYPFHVLSCYFMFLMRRIALNQIKQKYKKNMIFITYIMHIVNLCIWYMMLDISSHIYLYILCIFCRFMHRIWTKLYVLDMIYNVCRVICHRFMYWMHCIVANHIVCNIFAK